MSEQPIVNRKSVSIRQIITLVSILAAFGTNIWANLNPPQGMTIGDVSQQVFGEVLITPANYAFAIWGLIYLGLISFAIYQVLPISKNEFLLPKIGYKLVIASISQIIWVYFFLNGYYAASFLAMLCILLSLIGAYWSLPFKQRISRIQKWLIRTPLSIYLAWISVATVVNAASVLDFWQWKGWGLSPVGWTVVMLLIAGFITHLVTIPRLDFAYAGVFVWAAIAIAIKNAEQTMIAGTAIGLSIILVVLLLSFNFHQTGNKTVSG
ncbi:MAG: tryptophan-rich sensory protein [Cyanobacteria bacterium J06621_8]